MVNRMKLGGLGIGLTIAVVVSFVLILKAFEYLCEQTGGC